MLSAHSHCLDNVLGSPLLEVLGYKGCYKATDTMVNNNLQRKKNFKAAKTVSIVVGLFVVCWLPSLVTSFVHYFRKAKYYNSVYHTVWLSVEAVAFTSSAINPWVYCLRNDDFYEALINSLS